VEGSVDIKAQITSNTQFSKYFLLVRRHKSHPKPPQLAPDAHGLIWMPKEAFGAAFSQHAPPEQAALFAAAQRPIAVACIQEKASRPA
jgi:hypothetical protein